MPPIVVEKRTVKTIGNFVILCGANIEMMMVFRLTRMMKRINNAAESYWKL